MLWLLLLPIIAANDDPEKSSVESSLFTRYDRNAYVQAAGYPIVNSTVNETVLLKYANLDKDFIQRQLQRRKHGVVKSSSQEIFNKCTTYLAPSSIPNSGLGMYTTTPYTKGDTFHLPEIGIMLQDKDAHYPAGSNKLLAQYPWAAGLLTGGASEVTTGAVLVPGLGMLANSHLGLANFRHDDIWKVQIEEDGTDSLSVEGLTSSTLNDVGRGASSSHSRVLFYADKNIQIGEELFVNYGDEWFTAREEWIGVIPSKANYEEADRMIEELFSGGESADPQAYYEAFLKGVEKKDKRLRAAFPDSVEDVSAAKEVGTARYSAKTSLQSIEWLEENGVCIDNLVPGVSTIAQAGRGAFASRNIRKGSVITTTPLVTLEREQLQLWEEVDGSDVGVESRKEEKVMEMVGHQLLLNYCYGHANSSLLLFPYSPTVNFINHGSKEEANAEIIWSDYTYHKKEWLNLPLNEVKELKKTGLMFDIVATKDISLGEEVLLYYGKDWENSWNEHIEDWTATENEQEDIVERNITDTLGVRLNQRSNSESIIRTVEEQKNQPYPPYLETVCRFDPPEGKCQDDNNDYCTIRWSLSMNEMHDKPCDVISRSSIDGNDWYFARINITDSSSNEITRYHVEFLPRYAIRLVNRKYAKDQYLRGVFREVIGLPDGLFPDHWMDLEEDDERYIYQD